jgi:hypothetical protein
MALTPFTGVFTGGMGSQHQPVWLPSYNQEACLSMPTWAQALTCFQWLFSWSCGYCWLTWAEAQNHMKACSYGRVCCEAEKSHILTPAQGLLGSERLAAQPSSANNVTVTQGT